MSDNFSGLSESDLDNLLNESETEEETETQEDSTQTEDEKETEEVVEIETETTEEEGDERQEEEISEETSEETEVGDTDTKEDEDEDTDDIDYKAQYDELLAPLKASGKVRDIKDVEEARALMSFGVDYHKNMNKIAPFVKLGKTLEKNGLLDDKDQLNLLIDASNGDKDAIRALVEKYDVQIDAYASENDSKPYTPKDHTMSDEEFQLSNVIDEIRDTPTFDRTMDIVTKDWDKSSKEQVVKNPHILKMLNVQMQNGDFDKVSNEIDRLNTLNQIPLGMSKIDIYGAVAQQILKADSVDTVKPVTQKKPAKNRVVQAKKQQSSANKSVNKPFSQMTESELDSLMGE